jgi:hypothetical protein
LPEVDQVAVVMLVVAAGLVDFLRRQDLPLSLGPPLP